MSRGESLTASRQHSASTTHTTLSPVYETRQIAIAHGMEFHVDQISPNAVFQQYLDKRLGRYPAVQKISDTEYLNHNQRVRFVFQETTLRTVLKTWLATPELHVVYDGHARYGRGPCFGRYPVTGRQSDDWEDGTTADSGIFRLGYAFIGIPISEVIEHGYHANLVKESDGLPDRGACHPHLRRHISPKTIARRPEHIHPELIHHLRSHTPGDRYWVYGGKDDEDGTRERYAVHYAGWRDTVTPHFELHAVDMKCRVFTHLGCSSYIHNYPVVRKLAGWQHEGNERYAYWTTRSSYEEAYSRWLMHIVTYDEDNAFISWKQSLDYAVEQTNIDLRNIGPHRII